MKGRDDGMEMGSEDKHDATTPILLFCSHLLPVDLAVNAD